MRKYCKFFISTVLVLLLSFAIDAQEFVVNDSNGRLVKIDINNCTDTYIANIGSFTDLASHPDGHYYTINNSGQLYKVDLNFGVFQIEQFEGNFYYALTCDADGTLYAASANGDLASYNPANDIKKTYPNIGVGASGDLTFYKGQLYMATVQNTIISIHPEAPNLNKVIIDFSSSNAEIFGIVSTIKDCKIISYAISGDVNSRIFEIEWENGTFSEICTSNIRIYGGSSEFEYLGSEDVLYVEDVQRSSAYCSETGINIKVIGSGIGNEIEFSLNNNDYNSTGIFENLDSGNYTLYMRNEYGCFSENEIEILESNLGVEIGDIFSATCGKDNGSITISVNSNADNYTVNLSSEGYLAGNLITDLTKGEHEIFITDSDGCEIIEKILIDDIPPLDLNDLIVKNTFCGDNNGSLYVKAGGESLSYFVNGQIQFNNEIKNLAPGIYTLTLQDKNECRIDTSFEIQSSNTCNIYVPNIFSPNEDGINDSFCIYSDLPRRIKKLEVYDRWGNKMIDRREFNSESDEGCWDGRVGEGALSDGVYVYIIEIEGEREDFILSGDVTIKR